MTPKEQLSSSIQAEQCTSEEMHPSDVAIRKRLHKRLQRLLGEVLGEYALIAPGDRILLGISGGKDSLALLDLLGERMLRSNHSFSLEAIHVRMRNVNYVSDVNYLKEKAARWNIPLHVVETGFEPDRNEKRTPCFLCAWHRRKVLFDEAQRRVCNKIALGHHRDDLLRTALMNLTFNGSFSTMPIRLSMRKFPITVIRPLAKIPESDLRTWAACEAYEPVQKLCPHESASNRTNISSVIDAFASLSPEYAQSLWHALEKSGALVE